MNVINEPARKSETDVDIAILVVKKQLAKMHQTTSFFCYSNIIYLIIAHLLSYYATENTCY